jgi:DNA polymerase I-like protein with 3'-5' exonuclease and polymerase domains
VPVDSTALEQQLPAAQRLVEETQHRADELFSPHRNGHDPKWYHGDDVVRAFARLEIVLPRSQKDVLLSLDHPEGSPLADAIVDYRESRAVLSALRGLKRLTGTDGRAYPKWKPDGAKTGRLTCSEPALQGLSKKVRNVIKAPDGRVLVWADYKQIELVVAAALTGDESWLAAAREGRDLHRETAARLLGKPAGEVTDAERAFGKTVNCAVMYGMGPATFALKAGAAGRPMTTTEAKDILSRFYADHTALRTYIDAHATATSITTLTGRVIPVKRDASPATRLNYAVQGSAADGFLRGLELLYDHCGGQPDAFPILAVHDCLVVEAPAESAEAVRDWLSAAMLDGMKSVLGDVPVRLDSKISPNWSE